MNKTMKFVLLGLVFVLILGGSYFAYQTLSQDQPNNPIMQINPPSPSPAPQGGTPTNGGSTGEDSVKTLAPDFTVTDRDGNRVSLFDLAGKGKPVVLNFWTSWCPSCKDEMATFNAVYKDIGEDVIFMMVDLVGSRGETKEAGLAYVDEQGYTFPVYFDTDQSAGNLYGIVYIPTTLFIDGDGYIAAGAQSALDEETLRYGIELAQKGA